MLRFAVSGLVIILAFSLIVPIYAQEQPYNVVKAKQSESFTLPFQAANHDRDDPLVYTFDEPKGPSWIMNIENKLSYVPREDSKVIIILREPAPSEKYIQLAMYGGESRTYQIAVNTPETGHAIIHNNSEMGWWTDNPIAIGHANNQGLSASNGKRIVLDRYELNGFTVGSIEVYGKDEASALSNAYGGDIAFSVFYGSPENTPTYLLPGALAAGVGGLMAVLLLTKKRKK
jgi:hypothetical protein